MGDCRSEFGFEAPEDGGVGEEVVGGYFEDPGGCYCAGHGEDMGIVCEANITFLALRKFGVEN